MNIRPSTPQILRDLAEELNREILPLLSDATDQVRLHMIAAVLGQCAVRAGSEIAVTKQETADYRDYAGAVVAATGHNGLRAALDGIPAFTDLHLDVVLAEYAKVSDAFALALEVAMDEGLGDLVARGEGLLKNRVTNEQLMAGVATAGR